MAQLFSELRTIAVAAGHCAQIVPFPCLGGGGGRRCAHYHCSSQPETQLAPGPPALGCGPSRLPALQIHAPPHFPCCAPPPPQRGSLRTTPPPPSPHAPRGLIHVLGPTVAPPMVVSRSHTPPPGGGGGQERRLRNRCSRSWSRRGAGPTVTVGGELGADLDLWVSTPLVHAKSSLSLSLTRPVC